MKITNDDLKKHKYTMDQLKNNIYCVSLLDILKTQKLTIEFCVNYLLNDDFQVLEEEENISMYLITQYQHHISFLDLLEYTFNTNKKSKDGKNKLFDFMDYICE